MEIAEFLLARIADDEAVAKAALRESSYEWSDNAFTEAVELAEGEGAVKEATRHIARWDPARVLAECEAKRRIVEEARRWGEPRKIRPEYRGDLFVPEQGNESLIRQYRRYPLADEDDDWPWDLGRIWKREDYEAQVLEPQREFIFLRLLALPYADHPDYDEAWKP